MNRIKKLITWLLTKSEVKTVSEPIIDPATSTIVNVSDPAAPAGAAATSVPAITVADHESILAKLKATLIFAGHDVEAVFEEAVALAKKL